jgi:photosystem II stability/assembly factor-like uncharacterized protein
MKQLSRILILIFCVFFVSQNLLTQGGEAFNEDLLKSFKYRALGPARKGGRILRIVVPESQPYTFYVVTATGGLWKTENNGTTFTPVFENESTMAIGDMAVAVSDPDVLYIGTGTPASGRISLRGDGVYKSVDGGKTWKHMGLGKTAHIGRVAVHPQNPDIVYVAALGFHFSFNPERGIYKTTDGGETWEKVLFISERVGFVEAVIDPKNPDTVFVASYDKWRVPWHFEEEGPETAIFKTTDGGKNWKKLTQGLPQGKLGRTGIAIYPKNTNIIYASIENAEMRPPTEREIEQAKRRGREPEDRKIGRQVYRSDDGGESWTKMSNDTDGLSGGKWYGIIYIDPNDENTIYLPSTPLLRSADGGKTWGKKGLVNIAPRVHVDHHAIWIDPQNSNHVILGNDGGLAVTYDWGKTWDVIDTLPIAQYYAIGVDMDVPYNIYGGTQDCGSMKIPSNSIYGSIWREDWAAVGGGDGMYNVVDPNDSRWLYNDSQFGYIQRVDQKTGERKFIQPRREEGKAPYRFNWTAPIHISPHNSHVIYLGAEVLLRSLNQGDDWQEISPDLTTNDPEKLKGNIEHCNITTISESPVQAGVIWVGTDDGNVQVTQNGGGDWTDTTPNLTVAGVPADYYVSRVFASHHEAGRAYVVKSGFQRDDFRPFVYKTEDFGKTWTSINGDLDEGILHVIVEDHKNPQLLFVGKEWAPYVTIDGGKHWVNMKNNMPTNEVYDMVIHPRDNDLVVATHGRGVFVTDISPLQEMNPEFLQKEAHLFEVKPRIQWRYRSRDGNYGSRFFVAPNEPLGLGIYYYLKEKSEEKIKIRVTDPYGEELAVLNGKTSAGINHVRWNMRRKLSEKDREEMEARGVRRIQAPLVEPGEYVVHLEIGGQILTQKAQIKPMPDRD